VLNVENYPAFQQTLQLPSLFTLKMATAVFAKTLDSSQHLMRLIPES
jgi:hypothetical protein